MARIPFERTAHIMRNYSDVSFGTSRGGNPIAKFQDPDSQPTVYSAGSFCVNAGGTVIVHDAISLGRFLAYNSSAQELCPVDYARWSLVLARLQEQKQPGIRTRVNTLHHAASLIIISFTRSLKSVSGFQPS